MDCLRFIFGYIIYLWSDYVKTYTICGSMKFYNEMRKIDYELEIYKGYNILQCIYCDENTVPTDEALI